MNLHLVLDGIGSRQGQLVRALRSTILAGRLASGDALPATRSLARTLGTSRNTVVAAYEQLAAEGMIQGRIGSGSFVQPVTPARKQPTAISIVATSTLSEYAMRALRENARPDRKSGRFDLGHGRASVSPAMQRAWRLALVRAADNTEFDYPDASGLLALREALSGYLSRRRGIEIGADRLLIVTGVQQGIDLAARVLLNPGQTALVEEPCYPGLRSALRAHGADVRGIPVDQNGLRTKLLASMDARLLAVTPTHQFPTGAALPLSRRLDILQWAEQCDAFVLEDDYDGEYRHGGAPLPAMKSLDSTGRVIYLGSLSRVLFPAARLGYLVLPVAVRDAFFAAKNLADRGSPAIEQRALADLIASGRFERLLLANVRRLNPRRSALLAAVAQHFPDRADVLGADAGMHLSLSFPDLRASIEPQILAAAADLGVSLDGINRYCEQPAASLQLLLGYAHLGPEDLIEAVRRLASVLSKPVG